MFDQLCFEWHSRKRTAIKNLCHKSRRVKEKLPALAAFAVRLVARATYLKQR